MNFQLLTPALVDFIHDEVLNPGELAGRARDKSLEGALARIDHRLAYGMIANVFDLAAVYAVVIATGHCYNDGNKRTAHQAMDVCLDINGIEINWVTTEVAQIIIRIAQSQIDEVELANWLRLKA